MREVLIGNGPDRQRREIDLARPAKMKQQIERALEGADAEREPGDVSVPLMG